MASDVLPKIRAIVTRAEAMTSGATRFFTGVPCKYGHVAERLTSNRRCAVCLLASSDVWRRANLVKVRAIKKAAYDKNPEKHREQKRAWCAANPEKTKESKRRESLKHKDRYKAYHKAWYANPDNAASVVARSLQWAEDNPERAKLFAIAKEGRRRSAKGDGKVSAEEITAILVRQKYRCAWSNGSIKKRWHMDHVVPLAKGGEHSASNLVGSCPSCNTRKSAKDPIVWAQSLGRLI